MILKSICPICKEEFVVDEYHRLGVYCDICLQKGLIVMGVLSIIMEFFENEGKGKM